VCTALAFVVFFALITAIGPARATVITYVNPAVAVLLGVLLRGEPSPLGIAVGFPLILIGSVLAAGRGAARDGEAAAAKPGGPEVSLGEGPPRPPDRGRSVDADLAVRGLEHRGRDPGLAVEGREPLHVDTVERLTGR